MLDQETISKHREFEQSVVEWAYEGIENPTSKQEIWRRKMDNDSFKRAFKNLEQSGFESIDVFMWKFPKKSKIWNEKMIFN